MKKFLALVLALLMALSCFSFAGADGETSTTPGSEEYNCAKDGHFAAATDEGKLVTKATCTNLEAREYTCIKCKEKFTKEIPGTMLDHVAADDDKVNYVDATCTSAAYYEHTHCKNCGQAYTVTDTSKPAKNHSWKDVTVVKPTCTTDGYTEQKCELCGATQKANITTKLGHVWSNTDKAKELMEGKDFKQFQEYYKAPTCLEYGYEGTAPYCVREGCTAVKEDESTLKQLDKLTHTAKDNGQPNSYGNAYDNLMNMFFVYDEDGNCIGSNKTEGNGTITKKEHNLPYGDLTYEYKAPTCADDGFVTVTCECGWTKTEKIAKLDHKYLTDGNTHKIPALKDTAYKAGDNAIYVVSVKYLDKNGEVAAVYDMMPPVGAPDFKPDHYMDLFDCTMEMVAHYECDICGKTWDGETFCFTEHQYAVYSVAQTDVKGHAHSDVVNNEAGEADYTKVTMPEWLESCHDFDVTYKCVRCQQTKTETVKGTGHDIDKPYMVKGEDYKKGTCTVPGSYFVTCSKCQTTLIVNKTETEPHTWERTELVNNTCTTDGKRVFTCKVCGATKTEIIPATGHEEYLAKTEAATCEKTGLKTYKCARCGEVTRTEILNRAHVVAKKSDVKVRENCTVTFKQITDKDSKDKKWTLTYTWDDCTKDGKLQFICTHCNLQTITYTGKADHNWELKDTVVADKPYTFVDDETCQQNFVEIYECKDCAAGKLEKNLKKVNISKKVEHELSTAITDCKVIKYARCGVSGEKVVKCEHCNEWVKVTIPAAEHVFKTTWDAKNSKWTYTCEDCGYVEDIEFTAPRFVIDASKIDWANKTTGKGYVKLENETVPTFIHPVVYLRWTWVTKDGCDVVADKVVELDEDENGYFFNAKGYSVSGATISELLIIVTDDANADDMNLSAINKLGYTVVKK